MECGCRSKCLKSEEGNTSMRSGERPKNCEKDEYNALDVMGNTLRKRIVVCSFKRADF